MNATLKDVAERAGVSRSAVSRTFTEGASVSAKTREKVELAARELGYSPNVLARSLTTRRTRMVGLVSDNFHNPLFLEVFDRFTRGLQDRGLRPLLVNLSGARNRDDAVRMLRQYSVDGVVVASSTLPPDFARAFRDAGVPVVNSFGRYSKSPAVDIVGIDNAECGRMAARELLARGYRRVAFLGGPETATSTQDRLKGFAEELARHPGVTLSHSFAAGYTFEAGRGEMQRLLQDTRAEAYFCGDDVIAIGALSAVADAGLAVPRDVGLMGLNDMEMAGWANINLTTIRQPVAEIIAASLELIETMMDDRSHRPVSRLFPCSLVERGTLRPRKTGQGAA
ncbi:MAG: LacI family DNA-binding transcriptional regulator [Paracoccaceae bacterium]